MRNNFTLGASTISSFQHNCTRGKLDLVHNNWLWRTVLKWVLTQPEKPTSSNRARFTCCQPRVAMHDWQRVCGCASCWEGDCVPECVKGGGRSEQAQVYKCGLNDLLCVEYWLGGDASRDSDSTPPLAPPSTTVTSSLSTCRVMPVESELRRQVAGVAACLLTVVSFCASFCGSLVCCSRRGRSRERQRRCCWRRAGGLERGWVGCGAWRAQLQEDEGYDYHNHHSQHAVHEELVQEGKEEEKEEKKILWGRGMRKFCQCKPSLSHSVKKNLMTIKASFNIYIYTHIYMYV